METRKLITSGPSSLVISLPLWWIKENALKKGMEVELENVNKDLLLRAKGEKTDRKRKATHRLVSKEPYMVREELRYCFLNNIEKIEIPIKDISIIKPLLNKIPGSELRIEHGEAFVHNYLDKSRVNPRHEIHHGLVSAKEVFQSIRSIKKEEESYGAISTIKNVIRRITIAESLINEWITYPEVRATSHFNLPEIVKMKLLLQELPVLLEHEIKLITKTLYYESKSIEKLFSEVENYFHEEVETPIKYFESSIKEQLEIKNKIDKLTQMLIELGDKEGIIILDQVIGILHSLARINSIRQPFLS